MPILSSGQCHIKKTRPYIPHMAAHFHETEDGFLCSKKQAIAHSRLASLPYHHTIGDWVSRDFPDAEYTCSAKTTIDAIDLSFPGITAIQGAKGLGKSKAIATGIRAAPDATVLFITFNRALAWASLHILGEHGKLYSEISGCIVPSAHPRACVVVNSIHRVEAGYDIVVIDEIVSVMTNVSPMPCLTPPAFGFFDYAVPTWSPCPCPCVSSTTRTVCTGITGTWHMHTWTPGSRCSTIRCVVGGMLRLRA